MWTPPSTRPLLAHRIGRMTMLLITGGRVHDPRNGIDGELRDLAIENGKIVHGVAVSTPERRIDASGCVVMPGGVDMHCHIAGTSVNRARRLLASKALPIARRCQSIREWNERGGLVPSTFVTGHRYGALGYTTAIEAAVAPSGARQCHLELEDTPNIDRAFLLLLANNEAICDLLFRGEREEARSVVAALLARTGAFGIKAVNPGGVALWKSEHGRVDSLDQKLGSGNVTPRTILELLVECAEELRLPHPVHIHANRLGVPGNIETTLETSRALDGRRHHLTHVQFHAYGAEGSGGYSSAAQRLVDHFNAHTELTMDVGQVMFEEALTLSADLALEHTLWQLTGKRYATIDLELETGCGMVPFRYLPGSRMHALQWAVGMEIFLLCHDPWRLALSTDHPNGGSFLTYPKIIALLMSREARREAMRAAHPDALATTVLADLTREYTLQEIAIVTRAAPARILGLERKGHLGPGADADVTVYDDTADRELMFRTPRYVIKGGVVIVEKGELREPAPGSTLCASLPLSRRESRPLSRWFEQHGSYSLEQLGPAPAQREQMQKVLG